MSGRPRAAASADVLGLAVVCGAAVLLQVPIYDRWVSLMDEGFVLQTAAEVMHGKVLYRDLIIPNPLPGVFYLLGALFRLFGPTLQVARLLMVVMFTVTTACVYRLARVALVPAPAVAAGLLFVAYRMWAFPHWHMVSYSTSAIFFATLGFTALAGGLPAPSLGRVAAAGLLGGLAILCKQDSGAAALAAMVVIVAFYPPVEGRVRAALALGGGLVAVALPILLYFGSQGALADLWAQTVVGPLHGVRTFAYPGLPAPWPIFTQDPALREQIGSYFPAILATLYWDAISLGPLYKTTAWWDVAVKLPYYVPIVALAAALPVTWRRPAPGRVVLVVLAAAFLAAFNKPRDWVHLMVLYYPTLLLLVVLATDAGSALPAAARRTGRVLGWLVVAVALAGSARLALDLRRATAHDIALPGGTVHVTEDEARVFTDVAHYVEAHVPAGDPLPVFPYHPLIAFLLGRQTGVSSFIIWPVGPYADVDQRLIADLERTRAGTIIYSLSQYGHLHTFQTNVPQLFAYLVERYELDRVFAARTWGLVFTALRRRAAPPDEGVLVHHLADDLPEATFTLQAPDGRTERPGAREPFVQPTLWTLRHVVAQRPVREPGVSSLGFEVDVPPRARLRLAYGMNPDRWLTFEPSALAFSVTVESGDGARAVLLRARIDPQRRIEERGWREADLDLGRWAAQRVRLVLGVSAENEAGERPDIAGWGDPRLITGGRDGSAHAPPRDGEETVLEPGHAGDAEERR